MYNALALLASSVGISAHYLCFSASVIQEAYSWAVGGFVFLQYLIRKITLSHLTFYC